MTSPSKPRFPIRKSSKVQGAKRPRQELSSQYSNGSLYWADKAEALRSEIELLRDSTIETERLLQDSGESQEEINRHRRDFVRRKAELEGLIVESLKMEHRKGMELAIATDPDMMKKAEEAFVDLLIQRYTGEGRDGQSEFKDALGSYYGAYRA